MFEKVLSYTGSYKKYTYAAAALMLLGVAASVLPFLFIYQIIEPLLDAGHPALAAGDLIWRVAAIAMCGVLYAVLYVKGLGLSHESAYHTLKNIRVSLQGKLEPQPLETIQGHGSGALKQMFIDDIESVELLLAHALPEGIANLAVPVFIYIAMFLVDWKLALLSLCSLPLGLLATGAMYIGGMSKMGQYFESGQKMNNTMVEYINGMEVVKVFNRDGESYKRFETDVKNYRDFTLDWYKASWPWMALYTTVLPCAAMAALPLGAFFVIQGYSTLADLVLILCMGFGIGAPLIKAVSFMSTMPQLNYKISALEEMMSAPPLRQSARSFEGRDHSISFQNVRFTYKANSGAAGIQDPLDGKQDEVLHGVSLEIPEGGLTALVGESGSGKSTLAKLLVHFYDVDSGSIRLGGQDLCDMSVEALNNEISYVAQEQFLFNMSLLENIRLGRPDASDEEVMAAAIKAQCSEFLARLPLGLYSMAGDSGKMLSGGERQRISLARAILKNAPVVVLDEATAFMDPENEEKMNQAIAEVIREKTVIVIAHRLHSIVNADQICVLAEGRVAACGTHKELLAQSSDYQRLWAAAEGSAQWKVTAEKGGKTL